MFTKGCQNNHGIGGSLDVDNVAQRRQFQVMVLGNFDFAVHQSRVHGECHLVCCYLIGFHGLVQSIATFSFWYSIKIIWWFWGKAACASFLALGFGGFTPQRQVFMWHLDGKPRCKGGLVDHGCILVINAVLNKKTFWSYSLWQYLSLYAHGADGSCRKKPNAKAHLANLPMKRWAFRWDLAGLWSETKDSTALSQFFWLVAHYSFGQKDFGWIFRCFCLEVLHLCVPGSSELCQLLILETIIVV